MVITRDGIPFFSGEISEPEDVGSPQAEGIAYHLTGPWRIIEEIPYQQNWALAVDPNDPGVDPEDWELESAPRSQVILGQNDNGIHVSIGAAIADILNYARNSVSPAPFNIGTVDVPLVVPWSEERDLYCGEAIIALLRWAPDVVISWDYSGALPVVNVRCNADLTLKTFAIRPRTNAGSAAYAPISHISIRPLLRSRKVPSVALKYVRGNRDNDSNWDQIIEGKYPADSTGRERGALIMTIELAGSVYSETVLEQRVKVRSLPTLLDFDGVKSVFTDPDDIALLAFWRRKFPDLVGANVEIKELRNGTRSPTSEEIENDLDQELEEGAITDWMTDRQDVESERQTVSVDVSYDWTDPESNKVSRFQKHLTAEIVATNARTQTYNYLKDSDWIPPEAIPAGLAQELYNDLSREQFGGIITLIDPRCFYLARCLVRACRGMFKLCWQRSCKLGQDSSG